MSTRRPYVPFKIAAFCGIVGPLFALINIAIAIMLSPWFSWASNALSDLGISPAAMFFNGGLIIAGVLVILFTIGFVEQFREQTITIMGSIVLIMGCVSLIMIGIFTEAFGILHFYVSVAFFVFFPLGVLIIGISFLQNPKKQLEGVFTLIVSIAALITWLIPWGMGVAVPEIIASLLGTSWVVFSAYKLFKETSQ